ncbi:6-bladed beta-propeller [Geobacter sp. AOG1]|uniref:6-bladed beta-propeller n=1 Tax=Geobacter sp. AOG1 TaxID=1566346 RepID=UPI001CC33906|nr:6-bladed beta-propeller [Geobacter sp. AOG1]GFE58081.1 hypothetical protein AOG1_19610 [Geobacter sp. AOG1]
MPLIRIVCDQCGFTVEKPASALPRQRVNATCPRCKHVFSFDPARLAQDAPTVGTKPPQPPQEPDEERITLKGGIDARANKLLFSLFLVLILVTVGVRLWADARYRAVPYPNLLAASADGVAVVSGQAVYLFAPDGTLSRTYPISADILPTQLFWDKGALCLGDLKSKTIVILSPAANTVRKLTGATINAQFKVAREPGTGRLFVSDSASHRILVFDEAGTFLRSFGREGKGPGEFRFPNELAFDEAGRLLIANTKLPSIEVYTPEGQYVSTLVTPSGDRVYRYPTDFALTPDRLVVLENDGFLERAKVRTYDRNGGKTGDLSLGTVSVVGDLVVDGERIYLSDCAGRQLLAFSLADLRPLGPVSPQFAAKCAEWRREAALFKRISLGSLVALFLFCAPVIFFYLRMKREETKELSRVDVGPLAGKSNREAAVAPSAELVLGTPQHERLHIIGLALLGTGAVFITLTAAFAGLSLPLSYQISAIFVAMIAFLGGFILLIRSGGFSNWKRKQTSKTLQRIIRDGKLALLPGERLERVALAQHGQSAQALVLVIFTDRRLLHYFLNWGRIVRIEQIPFEALREVKPPPEGMFTLLHSLQVTFIANGPTRTFKYYDQKTDFLRLLEREFSGRLGRASGLPQGDLCLSCLQMFQDKYCATCATKLAPDQRAMWLSFLFPGLGQLRNGELQKGLMFTVMTVISLLVGYLGIKEWFFEGADLNLGQKLNIGTLVVMAPIWYVANIVDAHRSSIRGRKPE